MKKKNSNLNAEDLMSIESEFPELGTEVFKKDGLLNLIVSFLDNKSYMQFINVKN